MAEVTAPHIGSATDWGYIVERIVVTLIGIACWIWMGKNAYYYFKIKRAPPPPSPVEDENPVGEDDAGVVILGGKEEEKETRKKSIMKQRHICH